MKYNNGLSGQVKLIARKEGVAKKTLSFRFL